MSGHFDQRKRRRLALDFDRFYNPEFGATDSYQLAYFAVSFGQVNFQQALYPMFKIKSISLPGRAAPECI
jgi:hypothetical protein